MTSRNLNDSEVLNVFKLPELLRSSKRIINIFLFARHKTTAWQVKPPPTTAILSWFYKLWQPSLFKT